MKTADHQDIKKLGELIHGIQVAMLTTMDSEGGLRSRPMATQETEFDGELWFFTRDDTSKVDEVNREEDVNLSYADPSHNRYVSISGKATTMRDRAKIDELWSPLHKAWFPEGKDDPKIALLKVQVDKAEYWEGPSSKVVQLVGFVKALATGKTADIGENRKLNLT